ncbi:hypothetical protein V6N12_033705 [Hibiscus sabdariffa]|uniref:Uncharacterized protein n=1 Tax=Hibiscus sabdariffa TaxID=183260 RepID=A0ABR1ZN49_9ROSI
MVMSFLAGTERGQIGNSRWQLLSHFRDPFSPFLRSRTKKEEEEVECFRMVVLNSRYSHRSSVGGGGGIERSWRLGFHMGALALMLEEKR